MYKSGLSTILHHVLSFTLVQRPPGCGLCAFAPIHLYDKGDKEKSQRKVNRSSQLVVATSCGGFS